MDQKINEKNLQYLQSLDLGRKIGRTVTQIMMFVKSDDAYISCSGGKGSTVLADINERFGLNLPVATAVNCEEPENIKIAKKYNPIFVSGGWSFKRIVTKYGYPVISKENAMAASRWLHTKREDQKEYRLWGNIDEETGRKNTKGVLAQKHHFLIYAPFEVTEQCCVYRKERPLKKMSKEMKRLPITAEMAIENRDRKTQYKRHGCIHKGKKCMAMGFWTEEDLDKYIEIYDLEISKSYDDPECTRTGCPECGFGILKDTNRYQRIKKKRPNSYNYFMGGGKWIRKDIYRYVKFRPNSLPIWSNLYWVPSDKGLGIRFVMKYINKALDVNINVE